MRTSLRTALTAVLLVGSADADDLQFFPRSDLTFEVEAKPSSPAAPSQSAPPPSDSSIPEAPLPLPALPAAAAAPVSTVQGRPLVTVEVKTKPGGVDVRSVAVPSQASALRAGNAAPSGPAQNATSGATQDREQEIAAVIDVQELSPEVRKQLEGRVQCADPLMAIVQLDSSLRERIADAIGVEPSKLGATLKWIFGRESNCSDGRTPPALQKALDAGARAYLRRAEEK